VYYSSEYSTEQVSADIIDTARAEFCFDYKPITTTEAIDEIRAQPTTLVVHGSNLQFEDQTKNNYLRGQALARTILGVHNNRALENVSAIVLTGGRTDPTDLHRSEAHEIFISFRQHITKAHVALPIIGDGNTDSRKCAFGIFYNTNKPVVPIYYETVSRDTSQNVSNTMELLPESLLGTLRQLHLITGKTSPGAHRSMMLWSEALSLSNLGNVLISTQVAQKGHNNSQSFDLWTYIRTSKIIEKALTLLVVNGKKETARKIYNSLQKYSHSR
jgi:hypothetical protein